MTGYLQRLAASVARPGSGLHPLVGSIFSGAGQEVSAPTLPREDASVASGGQNPVPTPKTVFEPSSGLTRRRDLEIENRIEQPAALALPADERRAMHEVFQPLLPGKAAEANTSATRLEAVSGDAAREHPAFIGLERDPLDTEVVDPVPVAHATDRPAASWRGVITPPPAGGSRESSATFSAGSNDTGNRATTGFYLPQSSQRDGDDIQIHIGRIEVTAIPPPAPRRAAAPERKAMSLGEYLSRGNRGPR